MKIQLDLRDLPAPEPMERILDALEQLQPHQHLEALTPFRPVPLFPILEQMGFSWHADDMVGGHARIIIRHRDRHSP